MMGKLIVIDGGEGTGTTSVAKFLAQHFGNKAIYTREPGGTKYAEMIRELIFHDPLGKNSDEGTKLSLFWAARNEHLVEAVLPALEAGKLVFTDRFDSSTYAYQICAGKRFDLVSLFDAYRYYLERMGCLPHHYFILDGNPRVCVKRAIERAKREGKPTTYFDEKPMSFHDDVRKGFLDFVKDKPHHIYDVEHNELIIVQYKVLGAVQAITGGF